MSDANPAILSDDEDSVIGTGQLSLLWARLHNLDLQLWRESRAIESERARVESLNLLVQEIRAELASINYHLNRLQARIERCENTLNLDSLD